MKNLEFRTLRADEIEVRPQSVKNGKATMLLYIDSRAVVSLLNETVGNMNWTSEFYEANGQMIGKIAIYDEDRDIWVSKSDTGSESNIEAEKGLVSDIYKRVLSRWGVQELYSSPRITWDDDGYGNTGYKVSHIAYDENRNIISLQIVNRWGKEAFKWEKGTEIPYAAQKPVNEPKISNMDILKTFYEQNKRNADINVEQLTKFKDFYKAKMDSWKGVFNPSTAFQKWMERATVPHNGNKE